VSTSDFPAETGERVAGPRRADFDLDAAWRLHSQVSVRPERFGALLYHFGTRRLSFLKSRELVAVVQSLASQPSARAACAVAGVPAAELPAYASALARLAAGSMICRVGGGQPGQPVMDEE
jgi:mycofactocin biosynthesis protein MftB